MAHGAAMAHEAAMANEAAMTHGAVMGHGVATAHCVAMAHGAAIHGTIAQCQPSYRVKHKVEVKFLIIVLGGGKRGLRLSFL